jgi:hypothetical protein
MAALTDVFLRPLGLAALVAAIPLIILYLVRPDPERLRLPTWQFLAESEGRDETNPVLERLQRNLLLLLQLLVLVALAASLATPYVLVDESQVVEETVIVVDASASMQTQVDGQTRFRSARAAATDAITQTTSVVVAGRETDIALRDGTRDAAATTIGGLTPTDAPGDLEGAITQATALAGEGARIMVYSDFAGTGWESAVEAARAQEIRVALTQFDGGGEANVGITDVSFSGQEVTMTVTNTGNASAERTLRLGGQSRQLQLDGGDVTTVTVGVPAGGAEATLTPADSFPVDDTAYVAAPSDATVDVLLVTNNRNRYLATALDVVAAVDLTVVNPPAPDANVANKDVVVFSNVDSRRLLGGTVQSAGEVVADGGGVVIQAQEDLADVEYRDLLLLSPTGTADSPSVRVTSTDPMTAGISFPPPETYITGDLQGGRTLVAAGDGTPLIATQERDAGRVLYYGYLQNRSAFKFNYQYPVFWKRAAYYLADRESLSTLNRRTADTLQLGSPTEIQTPDDTVTAATYPFAQTGWYVADGDRYGVSLLSAAESDVGVRSLSARGTAAPEPRTETRQAPDPITEWVALAALLAGLLELGYLKRRGDI